MKCVLSLPTFWIYGLVDVIDYIGSSAGYIESKVELLAFAENSLIFNFVLLFWLGAWLASGFLSFDVFLRVDFFA